MYQKTHGGWEGYVYLFSDVHIDSMYCDRDSFFEHMNSAKRDNAVILFGGDLFDGMNGRYDPRRSVGELRPEYKVDNYFDVVVKDTAELLKNYAERIALIGQGNHELAVLKHSNTNLADRLVYLLRTEYNSNVVCGGYRGWVRLMFVCDTGEPSGSILIRYAHSAGGNNAPVTRGVIETNRQAVYLPDANIVWNGHNHQGWLVAIPRERISQKGSVYTDIAWYVRTPGYKKELLNDIGFEAQRGIPPSPIGCVKIHIKMSMKRPSFSIETVFK